MPLISVITVTYNASATLGPTLASVAEQTFDDFEYLVIDGASSDNTVDLAGKCPRAHVVSGPDRGIYDAMNKGLHLAGGKYVIFMNAGDAFHAADTLQRYADAILSAPQLPGVVYGQTRIVDSDRKYVGERHLRAPEQLTARSFLNGMEVCHQAMCVRRDLAPDFDLSYRFSADYDWAVKVLRRSELNIYIPDYMADYLNEGMTTRNHRASLRERFRSMRRHYGLIPALRTHLRKLLTAVMIAAVLAGCSSKKKATVVNRPSGHRQEQTVARQDKPTRGKPVPVTDESVGELIREARKWIGTPYKCGGSSRGGTDCSGLIMELFLKVYNVKLPRSAAMQQEFSSPVKEKDVRPGDLVFFATGKHKGRVSHVGLYIGNGRMIHASSTRGVMESDLSLNYWRKAHHSCGRVLLAGGKPEKGKPAVKIDNARVEEYYDALDSAIDSLYEVNSEFFD